MNPYLNFALDVGVPIIGLVGAIVLWEQLKGWLTDPGPGLRQLEGRLSEREEPDLLRHLNSSRSPSRITLISPRGVHVDCQDIWEAAEASRYFAEVDSLTSDSELSA